MDFEKTSDIALVCKWLNERLHSNNSIYRCVISSNGSDNWMQKYHPYAKLAVELVDDMPFSRDETLATVWAIDVDETLDHARHRLANMFWSEFEKKFDDYEQTQTSSDDLMNLIVDETCVGGWKYVFEHISSREELELKLSIES